MMSGSDEKMNRINSSFFYKLGVSYGQVIFRVFEKSNLRTYLNICGRIVKCAVILLRRFFEVWGRCFCLVWENSFSGRILQIFQSKILRIRFFPGLKWQGVLEGIILLLIMLMPVLNACWYILPLLLIMFAIKAKQKSVFTNMGIGLFWLLLMISAIFANGFKNGTPNLIQWSVWLLMAWLVYSTFSMEFCKKVLKYMVFTSLIWLVIGFGQLNAGIPTPTGWLEEAQSNIINIRIYSVFGNPNIYGLYLLSILVLAVFLADQRFRLCNSYKGAGYFLWHKYYGIIITCLSLAALYFTYSRTAWSMAGVLIFVWVWRKARQVGRVRRLFFLSLILAVLFVIPGFNIRVASITGFSDNTLLYRIRIWEGVIRALKDFWLWGIGPANFQNFYPYYQAGNAAGQHAHQLYLQLWLENGILSLLAFGNIIKNLFTGIRFQYDPYLKPLRVILAVFLAYGFFETWWMNRFCGGYFWLLVGLFVSLKHKEQTVP